MRMCKCSKGYIESLIDECRKRIFESLGFVEDGTSQELTLRPPPIETNSPQGKQNRKRLLRAWVEISSWISDFKRVNGKNSQEDICF